jgi:hypothetical protein
VYQRYWEAQGLTAGASLPYSFDWTVPPAAAAGTYTIRIGVFSVGWTTLHHWNHSAGTFRVQ